MIDNVYSGAAELGRVTGKMTLIVGNIFALLLIGAGIYFLLTDPESPETAFIRASAAGFPGGFPTIDTAARAARDYEERKKTRKMFGWGLVGFGLLVLFGVWIYWYMISRSKVFAAASGVETASDLFLPDFMTDE
jgi:hypothetical protein